MNSQLEQTQAQESKACSRALRARESREQDAGRRA